MDCQDWFPWETREGHKAYLAYEKWMRDNLGWPTGHVDPQVAYLLERQHEANQWIVKILADQVDRLTREIAHLKQIVDSHRP